MKIFIATLPCRHRDAFHGILRHVNLALRLNTRLGMGNAVVPSLTSFTGCCDHCGTCKEKLADFRSWHGIPVFNGLIKAVSVAALQFSFLRQNSPGKCLTWPTGDPRSPPKRLNTSYLYWKLLRDCRKFVALSTPPLLRFTHTCRLPTSQ